MVTQPVSGSVQEQTAGYLQPPLPAGDPQEVCTYYQCQALFVLPTDSPIHTPSREFYSPAAYSARLIEQSRDRSLATDGLEKMTHK